MKWTVTVLFLLFLAGCVERPEATHEPMTAADGRRAMMITCPRSKRECLAEAASVCPTGYTVLDEDSQQSLRTTPDLLTFNGQDGKVASQTVPGHAYTVYHGEMLIRCRKLADADR